MSFHGGISRAALTSCEDLIDLLLQAGSFGDVVSTSGHVMPYRAMVEVLSVLRGKNFAAVTDAEYGPVHDDVSKLSLF